MASGFVFTTFLLAAGLVQAASQTEAPDTEVGTFQSGSCRIRYIAAGEGEPLILLHGWMSEASNWGPGTRAKPVIKAPAGFRVIAPDLRGHGESDKPHDDAAYGAEVAQDVIRLMEHLELKRVHIAGYSMGAYVAGKVVDLAPDRVISVTYGGSSPVLSHRAVKGFADAESFSRAVASGQLGQYLLDTMPAGRTQPSLEVANQWAERNFANQDVKALAAAGRTLNELEVSADRMRSLSVPTLFIYGAAESKYVLDRIAEAREVMPKAEVVEIPGANHITTLRSPKFSSSLVEFLQRHKQGQPTTQR
ncbi:MAG TPA: hypothetical protein DIS87_02665 [Armatimonadetes bacterium]|nr:hypothetical protein [Armatimonadota bacterium]